MHFTKEIRPYDIDNCATIMEWIKERRAYVKLPSHTSFVLWHTMASQPNFHELWVSGAVFKAEAKQPPKFEIGQRVNIAEEKRVAPNPDYAYGIIIDIDNDVDGTVMYKLHLRSGPYRREISVEEKYLVLAEHAAQPASEPKFKVGQKVKIVADLTGWHGTCAMVCAVNECSGDICVLGDVAKEYRWYQPYQLELEEKPKPKFKVGQLVTVTGQHGISPNQSCRVMSFAQLNTGRVNYEVRVDSVDVPFRVYEEQLTAVEEKPQPKFKAGDRVYLSCEGHYHNKQTGTVRIAYSDHDCLVQFDGHGCEHTVPEAHLWWVTTTVSAWEDLLSVVQEVPATEKDTKYDALHWAEDLILQLPQTHDGRNTWLMNHGSADVEVITDPEAVSSLLQKQSVIYLRNEGGHEYKMDQITVEGAKTCLACGSQFIWHRKEKRND
jgi:hypothetical protein